MMDSSLDEIDAIQTIEMIFDRTAPVLLGPLLRPVDDVDGLNNEDDVIFGGSPCKVHKSRHHQARLQHGQ